MADILIREIKFPQCCGECPFQASRWTGDFCSAGQFMMGIDSDYRDKHPNCPLVLLPEGHGRLGDLDALSKEFEHLASLDWNQKAAPYSWAYAYSEAQAAVDDSPTIVPAEGGTDNG